MISSTGSLVIFSVGLPSPTFSPVIGLIVVGVVIVLVPFLPFCTTRSSPGFKSGLNLRFLSKGMSSVFVSGSPAFGPYFVILSFGSLTISPVSGFLIPGFPGISSLLSTGALGSNTSLCPGLTSSPPKWTISSTGSLVIFSVGLPPSLGVVIVLVPFSPFCTTRSSPGFKSGSNSRFVSKGMSSVFVSGWTSGLSELLLIRTNRCAWFKFNSFNDFPEVLSNVDFSLLYVGTPVSKPSCWAFKSTTLSHTSSASACWSDEL